MRESRDTNQHQNPSDQNDNELRNLIQGYGNARFFLQEEPAERVNQQVFDINQVQVNNIPPHNYRNAIFIPGGLIDSNRRNGRSNQAVFGRNQAQEQSAASSSRVDTSQSPHDNRPDESVFDTIQNALQQGRSTWPQLQAILSARRASPHVVSIVNLIVSQQITLEANPEKIEFSLIGLLADISNRTNTHQKTQIKRQLFDTNNGVLRDYNLQHALRGLEIGNIKSIMETIFTDQEFLSGRVNHFENCLKRFNSDYNQLNNDYNNFINEAKGNLGDFIKEKSVEYQIRTNFRNARLVADDGFLSLSR